MTFTLRAYQEEATGAAVDFLKSPAKRNAIMVLPTGSGKSLIIANIAARLGAPVLIFQPSKEILEQNLAKLESYGYRGAVYCLESSERILTSDLRWIPCGQLRVGDKILSFDENSDPRRKWRFAEVTRSDSSIAECVRVSFEDGSSVICTKNHPWLVNPDPRRRKTRKWVDAVDLMSQGRGTYKKNKRGYRVLRVVKPWPDVRTYEAGWLAGIFDGEGTISRKNARVSILQADGIVQDEIRSNLEAMGFDYSCAPTKKIVEHRKALSTVTIRGGFLEYLRLLGQIRPRRLLADFQQKVRPSDLRILEFVQVVSVEPVGLRSIQQIETSSKTYIGEGFLMHNSASKGRQEVADITFATIGSVVNKADLFTNFPYVIIDECHLVNAKEGMYKTFLATLENAGAKVLGLTATPYRLASNSFGSELRFLTRTRPKVFHEMIYFVQNRFLFDSGYLARMEYRDANGFDRARLEVNSTGADYTDASVQRYYRALNFQDKIVMAIEREMETRKNALVFTRFVQESEYLVHNIPGAAIVTGETKKKDRERIIEGFKAGDIAVVCNVGVLTTGFDYPELETVIIARPTMSLGLYYQMIGRSIRPHAKKECARVVDLCGNFQTFGRIEDLEIVDGDNGKWFIAANGKQVTNIYNPRG